VEQVTRIEIPDSGPVNEVGRKPGDPSVPMLKLLGILQRRPVKDEVIEIAPELAFEADQIIKLTQVNLARPTLLIQHPTLANTFMLCRHWVRPWDETKAA
jgi:hypothetical protein